MKSIAFRTLLLSCLLFLAGLLAAQDGTPPEGARGRPGARNPIPTAEISTGRVFTTVAGRLEPRLRIDHKAPITGIVEEVLVASGQRIARGAALFSMVQDSPLDIFRPVTVDSRLEGVVTNVDVVNQQELTSGTTAVTVMDVSSMVLEAAVSDVDAFALRSGIDVNGRSSDGRVYPGILVGVSAEPDYETGLFTARFEFPGSPSMRVGTFLMIDVPVAEIRGIFVDPNSVVRRYGRNRVWTVDEAETLQSVEVQTGPIIGGRLLIETGLGAGIRYLAAPTGRERDGMALEEILGDRG